MEEKAGLAQRWQNYRPSKARWFWSCIGCVIATMIVGFTWGGWVSAGTASQIASKAAHDARAQLAAAYCIDKATTSPNAAELTALKKADSWDRNGLVTKAGRSQMPPTRASLS